MANIFLAVVATTRNAASNAICPLLSQALQSNYGTVDLGKHLSPTSDSHQPFHSRKLLDNFNLAHLSSSLTCPLVPRKVFVLGAPTKPCTIDWNRVDIRFTGPTGFRHDISLVEGDGEDEPAHIVGSLVEPAPEEGSPSTPLYWLTLRLSEDASGFVKDAMDQGESGPVALDR